MARPKKAKVLYDEDLGWYNEKTGEPVDGPKGGQVTIEEGVIAFDALPPTDDDIQDELSLMGTFL